MLRQDVAARIGLSFREWFWTNLDVSGGATACWMWRGGATAAGYPNVLVDGVHKPAHRVAYELAKGTIPAGMFICHTCDNPRCCNPAHLWVGTHNDNMADMVAKGRANGGRPSTVAEAELPGIIDRLNAGESVSQIARDMGVDHNAIYRAFKASKKYTRPKIKPLPRGGRPVKLDAQAVVAALQTMSPKEAARHFGTSRATIYRTAARATKAS